MHSPDDLPSRRAVIEHYRATENAKAALAQLEKLVLIQPLDAAAQTALSELLLCAGRAEEALLAADCAAATAKTPPSQAAAHVAAARALAKLGRTDEARERLAEALRVSPSHADAQKALEGLDSRPGGER
jgi:predicted Zn-dependent protease